MKRLLPSSIHYVILKYTMIKTLKTPLLQTTEIVETDCQFTAVRVMKDFQLQDWEYNVMIYHDNIFLVMHPNIEIHGYQR